MGMNAYLENTPKEQRTLVDIENIFDGHCKNPIHLIMPQLARLVATIYKTDIPHVVLLYQLNVATSCHFQCSMPVHWFSVHFMWHEDILLVWQ